MGGEQVADPAFIRALTIKEPSDRVKRGAVIVVDNQPFEALPLRAAVKEVELHEPFTEILRWAGAGYLLWMGARMIRDSWRRTGPGTDGAPDADGLPGADDRGGFAAGWRRGALTNLLNPKVGVFYMALLPQFIPAGAPHLAFGTLLTCEHILLGTAWSAVLVGFARVVRRWLAGQTARRMLDRVTGGVIAAFGLRLALGD